MRASGQLSVSAAAQEFRSTYRECWLIGGVLLAGVLGWEIAARGGWISTLFFPSPSLILLTLGRVALTTAFWSALVITMVRLLGGVMIGATAGLLLGWGMGTIRAVRVAFEPIVAVLHPLPKLAIFPLFLVLLGIGEASKIAVVAVTAFFPMLINTLAGVEQIDRTYWEVAANYGVTGRQLLRRLIIPGSLPMTLVGLRLAVNNGLILTVAVEMLSTQQGLGARIWLAWQTLRLHELYVMLIVIGALGLLGNVLLNAMARYLLPWNER